MTLPARISVGLVLATASACGPVVEPQRPGAAAPLAVTVEAATVSDRPERVEAGGTVRARTVAVLSSRIVAPIVEVRVRPGDRVRAGQPLVVLDARELQAVHAGADASVAAAGGTVVAVAAEEQAAQAALTLATATHARIAGLRERNSATPGELDEAVAALRGAEARLAAARARQTQADRALDAARAGQRAAAVGSSYGAIVAPFDGIVTLRSAEPGALAAPGTPLLTVEDDRRFRLELSVDASRLPALRAGVTVPVSIDAGGGQPLEGVIAEVGRSIDPSVHSTIVKIDLPGQDWLRSGMFGRAQLPGPSRRTLTVPAAALLARGQLTVAFVEADGVARMRMVHAGPSHDGRVEILAGIAEGERVIVSPPPELADGHAVSASLSDADGRNR